MFLFAIFSGLISVALAGHHFTQSPGDVYQAVGLQNQGLQHQGFEYHEQIQSLGDSQKYGAQEEFQGHQAPQTFHHQGLQHQALPSHQSGYSEGHQSTLGNAKILRYQHDSDKHNYQYAYETDNGIKAQEVGSTSEDNKGKTVQGAYSYTGDDGQVYTVTYTADENGFHPEGAHLPTPPPMPEDIAKSVEQNLRDEANGIVDDGHYQHDQYEQQSEHKPQISSGKHHSKHQNSAELSNPQHHTELFTKAQHNFKGFTQPLHNSVELIKPQRLQAQVLTKPQYTTLAPLHKLHTQVLLQPKPQSQEISQSQIYTLGHMLHFQQPELQQFHQPQHEEHHHIQGQLKHQAPKEERRVEYHVPAMKQHSSLVHPQQFQPQMQEHRYVEYQVPTLHRSKLRNRHVEHHPPTTTQHKRAQDYIGPAPVVEQQFE